MVSLGISVVFIYLLCFQVSQSVQSIRRFQERLDTLEEELITERRHRREDVRELNHQLESLRQACDCDTSEPVTPSQILTKAHTITDAFTPQTQTSIIANLRLAFKQEKQEKHRFKSGLADKNNKLESALNQKINNVTKNIMDTKHELVDKHNDLVKNVTHVIGVTNRTLAAHMLSSLELLGQLKNEMENKILLEVNKKLSSLETCKQQENHNTSNASAASNECVSDDSKLTVVQNCPRSESKSGIYVLSSSSQILDQSQVFCDTKTDGGGWLVFQRRLNGSVDFYRGWEEYKVGFGSPTSEIWWGLEKLYVVTHDKPCELRVDLEDFSGNTAYAHYATFRIASESDKYAISVSGYSGTAGDALAYHNGRPFSTKDRKDDSQGGHCAVSFTGAWWFNSCIHAHLNGKFKYVNGSFSLYEGPRWRGFNEFKVIKFVEMKLRYQ